MRAVTTVLVAGDRLGLAERLRATGADVRSVPGPFASADAARRAFAVGGSGIDVVLSADFPGATPVAQPLVDTTEADWDARAEAPLRTARYVCQAAFTHLQARGGRIVLVTATAGLVGATGFAPVAAAAEGTRTLAKAAARQWGGRGITVNCVAVPVELLGGAGDVSVDPPALGRPATVEDVAGAIALLAGEGAGAITGATITVDGGIVMR